MAVLILPLWDQDATTGGSQSGDLVNGKPLRVA
jgi:hypothetical protein